MVNAGELGRARGHRRSSPLRGTREDPPADAQPVRLSLDIPPHGPRMTDQLTAGAPTLTVAHARRRLVWCGGFVNDIGDWLLMVACRCACSSERVGSATAILFVVELVAHWCSARSEAVWSTGGFGALIVPTSLKQSRLHHCSPLSGDRIWPAYLVVGASG